MIYVIHVPHNSYFFRKIFNILLKTLVGLFIIVFDKEDGLVANEESDAILGTFVEFELKFDVLGRRDDIESDIVELDEDGIFSDINEDTLSTIFEVVFVVDDDDGNKDDILSTIIFEVVFVVDDDDDDDGNKDDILFTIIFEVGVMVDDGIFVFVIIDGIDGIDVVTGIVFVVVVVVVVDVSVFILSRNVKR